MTDLTATYFAPGQFPGGVGTEIVKSDERSFLANLRDAGSARLVLQNDNSVQPAVGGVVAWDVKGTRAFASLCKTMTRVTFDPGGEAKQKTTWEMPGHLAIFKDGVIGPPGGVGRFPVADTIAYNYTHFDYDDTAWSAANVLYDFATLVNDWAILSALAGLTGDDVIVPGQGFKGDTASAIAPTSATTTAAPEGDWYFRGEVTIAVAGLYTIYLTSDDYATLYLDGLSILTNGGFTEAASVVIELSADTHVLSGTVHQYPPNFLFPLLDPTYVIVSCFPGGGRYIGSTPAFTSDASWKVLDYPADIPGMTVGTVLRLMLEEQIAFGLAWASLITLDFSDTVDSHGVAWPYIANITATVERDACLDLIEKLQATYADIVMDPTGWTLHAYAFETLAPPSGVSLTSPGNITQLIHKTEAVIADKLLVRSDGLGWSTVGSGTVAMAGYELGSEVAATEVTRIGEQVITIYGDSRLEITAAYLPASNSEVPWLNANFVPGAIATAPDLAGSPTAERVLSIQCSLGQDELFQVVLTLKDRIQELNERIVQDLKT